MRYNDQIQTVLTDRTGSPRSRFNDSTTELLFEGRIFAQDGGRLDVAQMAQTLCPPFMAVEEFQTQLSTHLDTGDFCSGLVVFETGNRVGHCQVRILARNEEIRAICALIDGPPLRPAANTTNELASLTAREKQVLSHLVRGVSTKQVAAALFLSPRTIEKHRARIYRKTGTHSLAILTRMWLEVESILCEST